MKAGSDATTTLFSGVHRSGGQAALLWSRPALVLLSLSTMSKKKSLGAGYFASHKSPRNSTSGDMHENMENRLEKILV